MGLEELGAMLEIAHDAIDSIFDAIADAIEEDHEEVVEILRDDAPAAERLERIKELVDDAE